MAFDFLCEQYEALDSNSTLVESYQSTHGIRVGFLHHVRSVFGENYFFYPLPTPPQVKINFEEPVMLDETIARHLKFKRQRKQQECKEQQKQKVSSNEQQKVSSDEQQKVSSDDRGHRRQRHCASAESRTRRHMLRNVDGRGSGWMYHVGSSLEGGGGGVRQCVDLPPLKRSDVIDEGVWSSFGAVLGEEPPHARRRTRKCDNTKRTAPPTNGRDGALQRNATSVMWSDSNYVNVYVRPKYDIGVDLDDNTHFVNLSSSGADDVTLTGSSSGLGDDLGEDTGGVVIGNQQTTGSDCICCFAVTSEHCAEECPPR